MQQKYYIASTKYTIQERQTKKGKVYDLVFRIVEKGTFKEKQKKLSGFPTKTAAKEAYLKFTHDYCELMKNVAQRRREAEAEASQETLIFSTLAKSYFESMPNQIKDATIYEKQKIFDLLLFPRFGNMELKQLTVQELYKWQDELWAQKNPKSGEYYSYKYLSKIRAYLSAFLTWCSVRYQGVENNLLKVQKPKRRAPQVKMHFWTREEFDKFISVVESPMYHALFSMLFFTGRRKGEVLALFPEDVDLEKGTISFTKSLTRKTLDDSTYKITSTKTELQSATPICDTLLKELQTYQGGKTFFFGGETPVTDNTLRRAFNSYADKAGVKQIRIHDLRHSFVSMCIHLGASIPVVADLIGDTIAQVTKTYAHLYETDKRNIITKIG